MADQTDPEAGHRRNIGYYWVKIRDGEQWTPSHYDGSEVGPWTLIGDDRIYDDRDIAEIGKSISLPT